MTVPEVRVWFDHARRSYCILIMRGDGLKDYVANPMGLEFVEAPSPGTPIEPSLQFFGYDGEAIVKQIVEVLAQEGIKADSDAKISGTLEATRYHLEDLRTALKNQGTLQGAK